MHFFAIDCFQYFIAFALKQLYQIQAGHFFVFYDQNYRRLHEMNLM